MSLDNAEAKVVTEMARSLMALVRNESCGECLPCWHGVKQIAAVLDRIGNGGTVGAEDAATLGELARTVSRSAKCGVGRIGGRLVLDLMARYPSLFQSGVQ